MLTQNRVVQNCTTLFCVMYVWNNYFLFVKSYFLIFMSFFVIFLYIFAFVIDPINSFC